MVLNNGDSCSGSLFSILILTPTFQHGLVVIRVTIGTLYSLHPFPQAISGRRIWPSTPPMRHARANYIYAASYDVRAHTHLFSQGSF